VLTIENYTLLIDDQTIPLPHLSQRAQVKVWRVPTEYRSNGIFVSVTPYFEPEEIPACNLADCKFLGEASLDPHPDAVLNEYKKQKKKQIEAERDAACVQPVTAFGHVWDADKRSQELLISAITVAQAGGALPAVWRDHDNNNVPISSINDLLAIVNAIADQTQTAYFQSWARKAAVDAAQTIDEVEAA
jgi:hypothetical protein